MLGNHKDRAMLWSTARRWASDNLHAAKLRARQATFCRRDSDDDAAGFWLKAATHSLTSALAFREMARRIEHGR